jgi:hypothetical protein
MSEKQNVGQVQRYLIAVSVDNKLDECFQLEGVKGDTKTAFQKFLNWYLVYRSVKFDGLVADDIGDIVDEVEDVELEGEYVLGKHKALVPVFKGEGEQREVTHYKKVEASFFAAKFGMMLTSNH